MKEWGGDFIRDLTKYVNDHISLCKIMSNIAREKPSKFPILNLDELKIQEMVYRDIIYFIEEWADKNDVLYNKN